MTTRLVRFGMFLILFAIVGAWRTWPLVTDPSTLVMYTEQEPHGLARADVYLTSWMLAWGIHALTTAPLSLFDANIFHPLRGTFAFSENLLAGALLLLPTAPLHLSPLLLHNLLVLASFMLGGTGTALLVRELGGSYMAAIGAGILFVTSPTRDATIAHVHELSSHWAPFALLALVRLLRTNSLRAAVGFAVALFLVAASNIYLAYFFAIGVGVFFVAHWALRCPSAPHARRSATIAGIAGALAFLPVMWPYASANTIYALGRDPGIAFLYGVRGSAFVGPLLDPVAFITERWVEGTSPKIVLGLAAWVLIVLGLWHGARRGGRRLALAFFVLAFTMALVSMGPFMQMHGGYSPGVPGPFVLLSAIIPGFSALRSPGRANAVTTLATAILGGLGIDALATAPRRRLARVFGATVAIALVGAEAWVAHPFAHDERTAATPLAAHRWIAEQPDGEAVVDIPIGTPLDDGRAMLASTAHWRPILNGYSGFTPTTLYTRRLLFGFPHPEALRVLHALGVKWVVIRRAEVRPRQDGLCTMPIDELPPQLTRTFVDDDGCVLMVHRSPLKPRPLGRLISVPGLRAHVSDGSDTSAMTDGDLATHWRGVVDQGTEGWLDVDFGQSLKVSGIRLRLGAHFGEYLRSYVVQVFEAEGWRTVAAKSVVPPPLERMMQDRDDLWTDIGFPPTTTSRVRIIRPASTPTDPLDLWVNWKHVGIHEIEVFGP